ncbi:competence protein CoiA family protein [Aquisalibacillus elongatus]|uniref:Competence protein CoiA-like protein n=1 Tax=Aquisalibacillus elongatus TaxID=485577 RepID=A0A3N5C4S0_9BACI|nr:competence protein CoiA family protein [Aquisalibacillus elongatus]RPF54422.1 competence protein CoiA-like protein [Aquisalibacillus elongatus]
MREAIHAIDETIEVLPFTSNFDEINNFKKLAKKGIYKCPYCNSELIVKSGEEREVHFAHKHSEACIDSKEFDQAEKRYSKQIERETKTHKVLVDIVYDELTTQTKVNNELFVEKGYRFKTDLKYYPDIITKVNNKTFAISIVTNVSPTTDSSLAKQINTRHEYFKDNDMIPLWYIEKKESAIEKDKNAIVLWDAENNISSKTKEDREWDRHLEDIIKDKEFFKPFNYPISMDEIKIDVRSMYYIYSTETNIKVKLQRFLRDRTAKPFRAFLLLDGYELPFASTLRLAEEFELNNAELEKRRRSEFYDYYFKLNEEYNKKMKDEEEAQLKLIEDNKRKHQLNIEKIKNENVLLDSSSYFSYDDLRSLLKEKINLTQKEQNLLWSKYMTRIGFKNPYVVWNVVVKNGCKSFDDLHKILDDELRKRTIKNYF